MNFLTSAPFPPVVALPSPRPSDPALQVDLAKEVEPGPQREKTDIIGIFKNTQT